jgi:hypothetical protein
MVSRTVSVIDAGRAGRGGGAPPLDGAPDGTIGSGTVGGEFGLADGYNSGGNGWKGDCSRRVLIGLWIVLIGLDTVGGYGGGGLG